jgi:hypothetical protein
VTCSPAANVLVGATLSTLLSRPLTKRTTPATMHSAATTQATAIHRSCGLRFFEPLGGCPG